MRLTVIGNPVNRRAMLFTAAVRAAGLAPPDVVSWKDLAAGRPVRVAPGSVVRIDSPGEDAEVDQLFRRAATPAEPGEIVGTAAWYRGFATALARVAALPVRLLNDPTEILTMFDKRTCHARLLAHGIPVPAALPVPRQLPASRTLPTPRGLPTQRESPMRREVPMLGEPVPPGPLVVAASPGPGSYAELRTAMAATGWSRVFVKPAHGSSASGVLALRTDGERVRVTTSVELDRRTGRLFNSLRVRDYHDEQDIQSIVDKLARDGLQVERWFPKAGLAGQVVDLRVVVIAGRPTHAVVRASRSPMTNLHLGGRRGDLDELRRTAGEANYAAAMQTCVRVAECFPGSLHVGVDLMFSPDWRRHLVAEVNAFGDLLPGLTVGGRDTYAEQVAALVAGWPFGRSCAIAQTMLAAVPAADATSAAAVNA